MQNKNKLFAAIIILALVSSMTLATINIQLTSGYNAQTQAAIDAGMNWKGQTNDASNQRLLMWERYKDKVPTYTYAVISPNPVGIGQRTTLILFNPMLPMQASDTNDIRYHYKVIITDPDGITTTLPSTGTIDSDSTGSAYTHFTPTKIGNHTVTVIFQELYYKWNSSPAMQYYTGVTLLSSNSTYILTVQEDEVTTSAIAVYPLPEEYWTRPIDGQNDSWGAVSSNWLNNAKDKNNGGTDNRYQNEGVAPNSGHILWTKVTEDGGVVGGDQYFAPHGEVFNAGHQYQTRFQTQIIMHGRLTYNEPILFAGTGGDWVTVDLKTGEEVWRTNALANAAPSFGYYYDLDNMNQHGVATPGYIFTSNFGRAIHPRYGTIINMNVTGAPTSNAEVIGPKGETLRYIIQNSGTTASPSWRLYQWNSSKVLVSATNPAVSGSINAAINSNPPRFDYNVSITGVSFTGGNPIPQAVVYGEVLLVSNGSFAQASSGSMNYANPGETTITGISLKAGEVGKVLFQKNFEQIHNDGTQSLFVRAAEGVFVFIDMPSMTFTGYSMTSGAKLWTTLPQVDDNPYGYYTWSSLMNVHGHSIAYGKFFTAGYTGMVYAYDLQNGSLLWRQEAPTYGEVYKYYTLMIGTIADNKIFIGTHEHSADTPLLKGARVRVYDVDTGDEVWSMMSWAHPGTMAIADGVLVYWNNYDHQVYAVGKGPSSTTVRVENDVVFESANVMIKGTVHDVSAGTVQGSRVYQFPNGVAAVSDESQSQWMEYVYMQKPRPQNATGVEVLLSVIDPNDNWYEIGTTTSNSFGDFSFMWLPPVPGTYTVVASFRGSESYYGSSASSAFGVVESVATVAPPEPSSSVADEYFVPATVGIIVAIAVVGALLALLLLRKRA
jgi:hypothetical protein